MIYCPGIEPEWKKCPQCKRENSVESWAKNGEKCPNCNDLYDREAGVPNQTEAGEPPCPNCGSTDKFHFTGENGCITPAEPSSPPAQPAPIQVWPFYDAPKHLRALSTHGGDEDWLALVPPSLKDTFIPWLQLGSGQFGVCDISEETLPDGSRVYIGAHA